MSQRRKRKAFADTRTVPVREKQRGLGFLIPLFIMAAAYINVAAGSLFYPLDFDLGWHLRYGQDVVEHHVISSVNTYSAEMIGYHWRNSSWLSDVFRYILFTNFSFQGLMVAGVITMLITFYIYARASKFSYWEAALIFPFIVYMEIPLTSASFRAQLLSFTGIGIIMWILAAYQDGRKKPLWVMPLVFLVWANLHGGFFLGLVYLVAWTFVYILKVVFMDGSLSLERALKTHAVPLLAACAASIAATLANPWGAQLYFEHLFTDIGTRFNTANPEQYLVEWKPLFESVGIFRNHIVFGLFLLAGTVALIVKKKFRQIIPILAFVIPFYFVAIFSRRFAWTIYLMAMPIFGTVLTSIKPKNPMIAHGIAILVSVIFFGFLWFNQLQGFAFRKMNWNFYCILSGCSPPSADYVKNNLLGRKIYTTYDWGGWLIWNYPDIKPGVDGRMSTWTDETGHNAFVQYIMYEQNRQEIDTTDYDVVYLSPGKRALFVHMLELVDQGKWSTPYKDRNAFVFVRNSK